jgi:hypothetical protein
VVAYAVRQGADGVVEDQQVLVLILVECKDERLQDESEVRYELRAGLLFLSMGVKNIIFCC